jgi:hypothetical protein
MKYVMFSVTISGLARKVPIIFPDILVHKEVAHGMKPVFARHFENCTAVPVSAGDYDPVTNVCSGKSDTLKLESDPTDGPVISTYDYMFGL